MKDISKTYQMTFMAVMLALTIIIDQTLLGGIPLGFASAIITHIPTIICSIILGKRNGAIMGFFLGLTMMVHAIFRPVSPLDPFFANPLVAVLPRIFVGITPSLIIDLFKNKKTKTGTNFLIGLLAGIVGSITNTVLTLLALIAVYHEHLIAAFQKIGFSGNILKFFTVVIMTNGVAEAIVSAVCTSGIYVAIKKRK